MQWAIPSNVEVSAECRDLLTRLMVRDPAERIGMADIHAHPWFVANLPVEAVSMNDAYLADDDYSGVQVRVFFWVCVCVLCVGGGVCVVRV